MKKVLALLLVVATLFCLVACGGETEKTTTTTTTTTIAPNPSNPDPSNPDPAAKPDPADEANWKKVVNNVWTSDKGGYQMQADGWRTYTLYPTIQMVPTDYNDQPPTNAISAVVYDADPADVFAAKTEADFESTLSADITIFESIEVKGYPAYYAVVPGVYYVYVINTPNHKYFINFMQVEGMADMEEIGRNMMETIEIFK